jgi:hypothetical protein
LSWVEFAHWTAAMRSLLPPQLHEHRHEAVAVAIAAIGVGMAIGTWVIGPLVSRGDVIRPMEISERASFEKMAALPDPFPFRTPTPEFDTSGAPNYAAAAKEKALAEVGDQPPDDEGWGEQRSRGNSSRPRGRTRTPDRHSVGAW